MKKPSPENRENIKKQCEQMNLPFDEICAVCKCEIFYYGFKIPGGLVCSVRCLHRVGWVERNLNLENVECGICKKKCYYPYVIKNCYVCDTECLIKYCENGAVSV